MFVQFDGLCGNHPPLTLSFTPSLFLCVMDSSWLFFTIGVFLCVYECVLTEGVLASLTPWLRCNVILGYFNDADRDVTFQKAKDLTSQMLKSYR